MIGENISHYRILEKLGEGGMGMVYKAEDIKLDRFVALKFLPPYLSRDEEAKKRFIHEAKAASSLDHPNICTIHEIDQTTEGQLFVVMTCYEGENLKEKIERGPLKIPEVIDIAIQICQGLTKAHEKGIIHRDIKPSNIFITKDGIVKIIDFGLAKLTGKTILTQEGAALGTINFMSPEQAKGQEINHRTDIWSLGIVLYEMTTGREPFSGDYDQAVLYSILNEDPEPVTAIRTGVPVELEHIINKALAKDPDERYQHIDDMIVDLKQITKLSNSSSSIKPVSGVQTKKAVSNKKIVLSLLAVIISALSIFLFYSILKEPAVIKQKPIAVIAFANQTGDHSYDYLQEAIPNLLITSLEQSRYLKVMTWERMKDVLKQMGKEDVDHIDKDTGFELCQREGVNAIVLGSFIKAGNSFATDVKVLDVVSKELIKSASAHGDGVQSILDNQIDQLSEEIAAGIGLSQTKIESVPFQITEVTTSSMEAYNLFLRGRDEYEKFYFEDARRFLEKAISLDSSFTMAYFYLSKTYGQLFENSKSRESLKTARALSSRAPEKERLAIYSYCASIIENNPAKRLYLLEQLVKKYPQEKRFHDDLGTIYHSKNRIPEAQKEFEKAIQLDPGFASPVNSLAYIYALKGLYDKAIETLQKYASLSPGDANPYDSMGEIYLQMGRLDESINKYREALRVEPTFYGAYNRLAYVYALEENYNECFKCIDSMLIAAPSIALKANTRAWKCFYLDLAGRSRESLHEIDLIKNLSEQMHSPDFSSPYHWIKAWNALNRGDLNSAGKEFMMYSEIYSTYSSPQTPVFNKSIMHFNFAYVYLRRGLIDSARIHFEELRTNLNSVESYKRILTMLSGILEAEILLAKGRPDDAIKIYRSKPATYISLAVGWSLPLYNIPLIRDVVPRAFEKKGEPDSAIAEYRKLLRIDPDTKDRRLINPVYHYRVAKLYEQTGKTEQALIAYRKFLELWKDADKDQPILIDATKRYTKLGGRSL